MKESEIVFERAKEEAVDQGQEMGTDEMQKRIIKQLRLKKIPLQRIAELLNISPKYVLKAIKDLNTVTLLPDKE